MPHTKRKKPIFGGGQQSSEITGSNSENFVSYTIFQGGKLILSMYSRGIVVRGMALLYRVEVQGHPGSPNVKKQNFSRIPKVKFI